MEYLNDKTYKRGDDVRLELTVEAEKAKTDYGEVYEYTWARFLGTRGHRIDLKGDAPEIEGDEATIVLTGQIERAADDTYRVRDGIQGKIPGGTIFFEQICGLNKPLKVEGGENRDPNIIHSLR